MAKRTKTQKRRALISIQDKSWRLCGEGLISVKDYEVIFKATTRGLNKL
jgi:hypothetical protein